MDKELGIVFSSIKQSLKEALEFSKGNTDKAITHECAEAYRSVGYDDTKTDHNELAITNEKHRGST